MTVLIVCDGCLHGGSAGIGYIVLGRPWSSDRSDTEDCAYNPGDSGGEPISDDAAEEICWTDIFVEIGGGVMTSWSGTWNNRHDSRCSASRLSRF